MKKAEIIAMNLSELMENKGMTFKMVAAKSGISDYNLKNILDGIDIPTTNKVNRLAKALGCEAEEITKGIEKKKPKYTIKDIDAMARQEGLSYGQFVAKYGY